MTRSFYFVGGLLAMALIILAQGLDLSPVHQADTTASSARAAAAAAHAASDPVAKAIDDLAAWPVAAGR